MRGGMQAITICVPPLRPEGSAGLALPNVGSATAAREHLRAAPVRPRRRLGKVRSFATSDLPDSVPTDVLPGLRAHYTNRQIVELELQLVRCRAGAKLLVSLGLEPRSMPITVI